MRQRVLPRSTHFFFIPPPLPNGWMMVLFIAAVSPLQGVMTEVNDTHIHKQAKYTAESLIEILPLLTTFQS
ncbi:hypothetical protein PILCRDRAFT_16666 [Piloderma croceum F 1598]|uniref:Uncharacterized protein n=1 Tax=Piloderma croceum (strain F 1598) TaxID=765440 RepID=A0A0C3B3I9_PILCF|nr:hypothetical protein PILCRDRAFT_16666 [Piloderma croceum F 1598]